MHDLVAVARRASVEVGGQSSDDDVWLDGVNPGAFAVEAATLEVADTALRTALTNVFIDMAEDAQAGEFERRVTEFFNARDDNTRPSTSTGSPSSIRATAPIP